MIALSRGTSSNSTRRNSNGIGLGLDYQCDGGGPPGSNDGSAATNGVCNGGYGGHQSCNRLHTPSFARGLNLLDNSDTLWRFGYCPYRKQHCDINVIERVDDGATYYKKFFYGQDHQNWFGIDDNLGPVAVSIRREKVPLSLRLMDGQSQFVQPRNLDDKDFRDVFMYRLVLRTSSIFPLRGCVLEESIPALKAEKVKGVPVRDVLEFIWPELQLSSLHLGLQSGPCEDEVVRLDEAYVQNKYKVGLMYCREGQQTEEEMYNNEEGGPAFNEFLDLLGQRVRLKGFEKYKAGLCNKNDSTGLYSVYTDFRTNEIMFHVSTLLPFTHNNRQQLPRKRYIGNDIVTVVFQEPGALPFIPNIKSQFQHVFIVVRVHNPCSDSTTYSVAVSRSKSVPMFGPPIPRGANFPKSQVFADFLLTKIINAENAVHRSEKFVSMATRTRQELLKDLATNFVTQTTVEPSSKFNLFATKRKDKLRPRFSPDLAGLRGAISWRVVVEDCSSRAEMDAFVGITPDSIVIVQDNAHHDLLFLGSTRLVIGWTALQHSIRIYFHQGEALIVHSKDWESEDMAEISARLKAITNGAPTQEFSLKRNQMGQLGFHVQHDGLITEVENFGYAWQTGLRQGSRLVEICKHPVTALSHEQMVELLKTSMTVAVTVIPPHPDGQPRRGCNIPNCGYAYGALDPLVDGDYENLSNASDLSNHLTVSSSSASSTAAAVLRIQPQNQAARPASGPTVSNASNPSIRQMGATAVLDERPLSPPKSSNSSGYGTGSSPKSFSADPVRMMMMMTSTVPVVGSNLAAVPGKLAGGAAGVAAGGLLEGPTASSAAARNNPDGNRMGYEPWSSSVGLSSKKDLVLNSDEDLRRRRKWYDDDFAGNDHHNLKMSAVRSNSATSSTGSSSSGIVAAGGHREGPALAPPPLPDRVLIANSSSSGVSVNSGGVAAKGIGVSKNSAFQRVVSASRNLTGSGDLSSTSSSPISSSSPSMLMYQPPSRATNQAHLQQQQVLRTAAGAAKPSLHDVRVTTSTTTKIESGPVVINGNSSSNDSNNNFDLNSNRSSSCSNSGGSADQGSPNNYTSNHYVTTASSTVSSSSGHHPYRQHDLLEERRSHDAKVTYLTEFELNQGSSSSNNTGKGPHHIPAASSAVPYEYGVANHNNHQGRQQQNDRPLKHTRSVGPLTSSQLTVSDHQSFTVTSNNSGKPQRTPEEQYHYNRLQQQRLQNSMLGHGHHGHPHHGHHHHHHQQHQHHHHHQVAAMAIPPYPAVGSSAKTTFVGGSPSHPYNNPYHHQPHHQTGFVHRSEDELSAVSVGSTGLKGSPRRRRRNSRSTSSTIISASSRYPGSGSNTPSGYAGTSGTPGPSTSSSTADSPRSASYLHRETTTNASSDHPAASSMQSLSSSSSSTATTTVGVRKRSAAVSRNNQANRNSANFSAVQEDLMRLIGPSAELDDIESGTTGRGHEWAPPDVEDRAGGGDVPPTGRPTRTKLKSTVSIVGGGSSSTSASNGSNNNNSAVFLASETNNKGSIMSGGSTSSSTAGRTPPRKASTFNDELSLMRSKSRENIAVNVIGNGVHNIDESLGSEASYHLARPATVVSNNSSPNKSVSVSSNSSNLVIEDPSPLNAAELVQQQQQQQPQPQQPQRQQKQQQQRVPPGKTTMPLPESSDWTSLVDTATRAIVSSSNSSVKNDDKGGDEFEPISSLKPSSSAAGIGNLLRGELSSAAAMRELSPTTMATAAALFAERNRGSSDQTDLRDLIEKVANLETKLNSEAARKSTLEEEVAALREENLRLQEESQSASQQLKRFTEWFLANVNKP